MRRPAALFLLALGISHASLAAVPDTAYPRAVAAGYKALMACGALFNGGRELSQVEATELDGIYPEYNVLMKTLVADVDVGSATVKVGYSTTMPPRAASWRKGQGCTLRPIGWSLPRDAQPVRAKWVSPAEPLETDAAPWPQGDAGALAPKPPKTLAPVVARSFTPEGYGNGSRTTGVVVVAGGKIVAEQYAAGFSLHTAQRTWSVAKSLTATLMGVIAQTGWLRIDSYADIPEWDATAFSDPRRNITLEHLLRMSSGLYTPDPGSRTDALYFGGASVQELAPTWPVEVPPGQRFRYSNIDTLLAVRAVRTNAPSEAEYQAWPSQFFRTLGMTRTVAERDWRGNFMLSSQVWSTARDLARFGMLYLNEGVWNDERLLPLDWDKDVAKAFGPQPEGPFGYGLSFWLMNSSTGVPPDTFSAQGNRGQYVVIVPSRQVVIVRRGEDPAGAGFDIAKFTADVLATLPQK
ncbi:MAG: serine hydrolase domain-containing protein [Gammaproteobacteria bacterium]